MRKLLAALALLGAPAIAEAAPAVAAVSGLLVGIGVSAGLATFIATVFVYTAANLLINAVFNKPRGRANGVGSAAETNYFNTEAELRLIVGYVRTGGMETIPAMLSDASNGNDLHKVLAIAGHEVTSFGSVYFNKDVILDQWITAVAYNSDDGRISTGTYADAARIRRYYGTATQAADYALTNDFTGVFDSNFRGRGIAYIATHFSYSSNGNNVFKGVPTVTLDVNGAAIYDARLDSTQSGGSGSHRYDNESTWEFNTNPANVLAWYLMKNFGGNYDPTTEIYWPSFMTAATACDAHVEVPSAFASFSSSGVTKTGSVLQKTTNTAAWDSSTRSTDGITAGEISAAASQTISAMMFGLNTDPATDNNYTSLDYAFYFTSLGSVQIYESGSLVDTYGSYTTSTVLRIWYDGTYVRYFKDDQLVRTSAVPTADATYYFDTSFYSHLGEMTINVAKRFTFNGVLFAATDADVFADTAQRIVDAMLGRLIYANGQWSCYAGGWATPTFTIDQEDWVSPLSIRFDGGIDSRYNRIHVWYVDPQRNWQKEECFPRYNATYKANDGGEDYDIETEELYCTNEYEAQRDGEFLLRASRNQIVVSGRLPPRFQDRELWETGIINFADLGWTGKTFRITQFILNTDGSVDIAATEEQSSDWTDMTASEYGQASQQTLPAINTQTTPGAPTSLDIAEYISGTLLFKIGEPAVKPLNTWYQIFSAPTAGSIATSGQIIWQGAAQHAYVPASVQNVQYYGIRSVVNTSVSGFYPASSGIFFLSTPKADDTDSAKSILPDGLFKIGSGTHWLVTNNSLDIHTKYKFGSDVPISYPGTANYVSSGWMSLTASLAAATGGTVFLFGVPHRNSSSSYGLPIAASDACLRTSLTIRVNSLRGSDVQFSPLISYLRDTPNSLDAISGVTPVNATGQSPLWVTSGSVGSVIKLGDYRYLFDPTDEVSNVLVVGGFKVNFNSPPTSGGLFNIDILESRLELLYPANEVYFTGVDSLAHAMTRAHLVGRVIITNSDATNYYSLMSNNAEWPINKTARIRFENPSSNMQIRTNIFGNTSYGIIYAGTGTAVHSLNVPLGIYTDVDITRINSWRFLVKGAGL